MATHTLREAPPTATTLRWLLVGFIAGALSVLIFHQGAVAVLHALGITPRPPYGMQPTQPFGLPQIVSITFWGGVWGLLFAALLARLTGARLMLIATILGIVLPTLVAWFAVAPLKGQPVAAGFAPRAMMIGPVVNGAWGLGAGIGLALFARPRVRTDR